MARKLNTFVTVHERDDKGELTGQSGTFGPDDDLSKPENSWVEKAITNPHVWEGSEESEKTTAEQPASRPARGGRQPSGDTPAK